MLPNKYEKQVQDDREVDNDRSSFIPRFKLNTHANMCATRQLKGKMRFKSCDRIHNASVN